MSTTDTNKEDAISNLKKLLEYQKKEARETETLIQTLSLGLEIEELDVLTSDSQGVYLNSTSAFSLGRSLQLGVDYGFTSRSLGSQFVETSGGYPIEGYNIRTPPFEGYGPPANIFSLGTQAFMRNLDAIKGEYNHEDEKSLTPEQLELHDKLRQLTLNSTAIWEREEQNNKVEAPFIILIPYFVLCFFLDFIFENKYVPSRFYLLETVARVPYFSYISMLHLYESLGWWRRSADIKRVHFAEEWNEFHHLLVMESLGGDQEWWVRFLSYHAAVLYYWTLILLWCVSPTLSYKFSELLETHAVNTYSQLIDENEKLLRELPPSRAAVEYYCLDASDPLFAEYQTSSIAKGEGPRRPGETMRSLYDVFAAICADEGDHVSTMKSCLDPNVAMQTPSIERRILAGGAIAAVIAYAVTTTDFSSLDLLGITGDELNIFTDATEDIETATGVIAGATALGKQWFEEEGDLSEVVSQSVSDGASNNFFMIRQLVIRVLEELLNWLR